MGHAIVTWLQRGLALAGTIVLVVVGLLAFGAFAVAMRPVLMIALAVGALGCLVLSYFSPAFRDWFAAAGEREVRYGGLRLATDVAVHPSHSWARMTPGDVAVGADDFVQATLGPVEAVDLPPVGSRVEQGDRLFCLRRGSRTVVVRAPLSGTVVTRNEALLSRPGLVNEMPFTAGWAVRLRADNPKAERRRLLRGGHALGWFCQEIDRLIATVLSRDAAMPALADGGVLVPRLHEHIDDGTWARLTAMFFGGEPK